jgi:hypothetical protein
VNRRTTGFKILYWLLDLNLCRHALNGSEAPQLIDVGGCLPGDKDVRAWSWIVKLKQLLHFIKWVEVTCLFIQVCFIIWQFKICLNFFVTGRSSMHLSQIVLHTWKFCLLPLATLNNVTRWHRIRRMRYCVCQNFVHFGSFLCCTFERHCVLDC